MSYNEYTEQEKEFLKINQNYFEPLDDEEKKFIEDLNNNVYDKKRKPTEKETKKYSEMARNTLNILKDKQNKLITLRVNENIINEIKNQASNYGLGYQTYINIFLYQLANGKFKLNFSYN